MKQDIKIEIISSLLVFLFTYTACSKLMNYRFFAYQLSRAPMLGNSATTIAWLLPLTELITVVLLIVKGTRLYGLIVSFFMLFIFTVYISVMLLSGSPLSCSCGGVLKQLSWKQHLLFNGGCIVINGWGIWVAAKPIVRPAI
ncbi:MAG TPA: MauE/DoxX family redox-associated membrane protein [Chitinophagaceae bacterium]|nr:MauE/DoxX family redox-associated membrane protein [Chitinophagaceae bacterium]